MTTLNAVRTALATSVATIPGLRAAAVIPDIVNVPCAVVFRKQIDYDTDFSESTTYHFGITVFASRDSERASQLFLDNLCDPQSSTSVIEVIEEDANVMAVCQSCTVLTASEMQLVTVGQVEYLSVTFNVEVVV